MSISNELTLTMTGKAIYRGDKLIILTYVLMELCDQCSELETTTEIREPKYLNVFCRKKLLILINEN